MEKKKEKHGRYVYENLYENENTNNRKGEGVEFFMQKTHRMLLTI